eukprot:TRINITY_DN30876_c0_g1_i1.p1 TRINITY_DN30876_c0_g1~~TRINITY_DN30876_c0_g1_i1.p1  ORF type:complete len:495 (+),score=99.58 TRINITY_DN30876_c0_g1_i1:754-2238(+)
MTNQQELDTWSLSDEEDKQPVDELQNGDSAECKDEDSEDEGDEARRYSTWRAHWKYLYETMLTQKVDAPSSCLSVMPETFSKGENLEFRLMLSGCGGTVDQTYLTVYKVSMPERLEIPEHIQYNTETGELGGVGMGPSLKADVEYRIYHDGPVLAQRFWSSNPWVFATRSQTRESIFVFNSAKQRWAKEKPPPPSQRALGISSDIQTPHLRSQRNAAVIQQQRVEDWENHKGECIPDATLEGLSGIGDSLDISPSKDGFVAAASGDKYAVWKLTDVEKGNTSIQPITINTVSDPSPSDINSLRFNVHSPSLFAAGGSKASFLSDTRSFEVQHLNCLKDTSVLSLDWNDKISTTIAVGCYDGSIKVVDIRNHSKPCYDLKGGHSKSVYSVQWSPHQPSIVATGSADCNVCLWDIRGRDPGCHAAATVGGVVPPNELFFKHAGHMAEIGSLTWLHDPRQRGMIASVDLHFEEPNLHIWRPRNTFWPDWDPEVSITS